MIKKILITLFILLLIIAIGIISLIVFVDPNNFRSYITDAVKDKTGYELTIEGDLRWHIWPQVSILTDSVKFSDIGAAKPILTADNMRLDVELMPLLSKQLTVKNILVKSAVINITDESKGEASNHSHDNGKNSSNQPTTTVNQTQSSKPADKNDSTSNSWTFTLNKFEVADSTVVLQQNDDLINFRNLDMTIEQKDDHKVAVDLSGNVNRNQQDLSYIVKANVNLAQFPQQAVIELEKFTYDYKGVGVPAGELTGSINATINYQQSPFIIASNNLTFSVNENAFSGSINANLDKKPSAELTLNSDKVDITPFLTEKSESTESVAIQQTTPVVSAVTPSRNELDFLNDFNAKVQLNINSLLIKKIAINNLKTDVNNDEGITTLNNISFDFAGGHIAASGVTNGKQKNAQVKLNTKIIGVNLNSFFEQLEIKNDLQGTFNANGDLSTDTLNSKALLSALQGDLAIVVTTARLNNINIPSIIQNAVSQYTKDILSSENQQKYTEFHELSANAILSNGNMTLTSLKANSETLDVNGSGRVGMMKRDLDVDLRIKMLGGWNGKSETIAKLQQLTIPLRIYGEFANLRYQIEVDKLIKDLLSDKLQQGLDKLRDKLQRHDSKEDSKSESKQKAADILGGLIKKIEKK